MGAVKLAGAAALLMVLHASTAGAGGRLVCPGWQRTTYPVQHPYSGGVAAHWTLLAAMPNAIDLLILGNSHAAGWPDDLWKPLRTFNAGVGGDLIENLLWRLRAPEWRKIAPRNVLVTIGSNNLARGDCSFAVVEGVAAVFRQVRELWPEAQVFFVGIPPRGLAGSLRATERAAINTTLRFSAAAANVKKVDPDAALGCRGCYETDQKVHISSEGYVALTSAIKPFVK